MRNMKTSFSIGMRGIRKWTGNLKVILLAVYMMLNVVYCVLPIWTWQEKPESDKSI